MKKKISVMTPCFNEESGIRECYDRVKEVFDRDLPQYEREHLFIDNSSSDNTVSILKLIALGDLNVKIIVNTRNFGSNRSPHYGFMQTTGDAVVPIFADLQTPPEVIVELVRKWEAGYKVVIAVREGMREGLITRAWRGLFYSIMLRLSHVPQVRNFVGFGLFDRRVVDVFRSLNEPDPYFRGLVSEIGFEKAIVGYQQPLRKHGKSRHSFFDLLDLAIMGITTYSKVPIRLMTVAGIAISAASIMVGLAYLVMKLLYWNEFAMGQAPLVIGTFFLSAVNLTALGLVGEYVGLVLQYTRRFPLVVEKERVNFDESAQSLRECPSRHDNFGPRAVGDL